MKEIKAIIRPSRLADVIMELEDIKDIPGITISEVKRCWQGSAKDIEKHTSDGLVEYVPKIKLEVVVPDEMVEEVVSVIQKTAHTGNSGDGKIYIIPVDEVIKLRTNERGNHN